MTATDTATGYPAFSMQRESVLAWLKEEQPERLEQLWRLADGTRQQFVGNEVGLWGTVKLSNCCDEACAFCGLRVSNRDLARYRLDTEQVMACARSAVEFGCKSVLLQAGRDSQLSADWVGDIIRRIKAETGLAVALSLGERSESELAAWRQAGAGRYFLRFLTANTTLYRLLHATPCQDPRRRLPLLAIIRNLGYEVGSGIMVGFPGQSYASLMDDLELICTLDFDAILVGPYVPPAGRNEWRVASDDSDQVPNTDLAALKVVAVARQLCPRADIPSVNALAAVGQPDVHAMALRRGANALLPELTPRAQRAAYASYRGRVALDELPYFGDQKSIRTKVEELRRGSAADGAAANGNGAQPLEPELPITICMGSSCFSRGNNQTVALIKDFIARHHLEDRAVLEGHLCEGICKHGPNVTIGCEQHQHADSAAVLELLRRHFKLKDHP